MAMSWTSGSSKRAAEDFVRTRDPGQFYGQPTKKPRFDVRNPSALAPDAPEDDDILEADVIGVRGQQVRRGAVNIDGYDSDSDNDNFNSRAEAKAKEKNTKSQEEDTNDMFADLEEEFKDGDDSEGDTGRKGGGKKAVRFLDEDEIEGQIKSSKSGGHVSANFSLGEGRGKGKERVEEDGVESSSESEVDDAVRASTGDLDPELGAGAKKSHAPKLDAFNMRAEQEEGRFDDQGNYVRKAADPDAKHDIWLEGVSKKSMRKAKEAAEKREEERRKRALEDDAKPTAQVLSELIRQLERGETILEALARLGKPKDRKRKWQTKNKSKKQHQASTEHAEEEEDEAAEKLRRERIESITGAADTLLTRGQPEIYDAEREFLIRQYQKETGEEWTDPPQQGEDNVQNDDTMEQLWEYRWTDARDGGAINGPYNRDIMKQWNDAGYFGEEVEFRRKDGGDWTRVAEFA